MKCPVHSRVECRTEYHMDGSTAYCPICLKHYPMCRSSIYIEACQLQLNHEGPHLDSHGRLWDMDVDGHWQQVLKGVV
jgi:hypothetical protein